MSSILETYMNLNATKALQESAPDERESERTHSAFVQRFVEGRFPGYRVTSDELGYIDM